MQRNYIIKYRIYSIGLIINIFVFIIGIITTKGQYNYPKEYFIFPIKPGERNLLTGNFAELRTNHFHGGIDIKTEYRTGLPVYAAASGYVKRIRINWYGYGNALYIKHPNGLTTVYGHLKKFNEEIQAYIKKIMYKKEVNTIDYDVPDGRLTVEKKEIIAYSGNTGSSGGPHLHWEVRDEEEKMINPLYFNFNEIEDTRPPFVNKIAITPLSINSRVNGNFERTTYDVDKESRGKYIVNGPVYARGLVGVEVKTYDKLNGAGNWCGVKKIELLIDNKSIFTHNIEKIAYWENHYINTHINYKIAKKFRHYFQRLYKVDGNLLNTYNNMVNNGKYNIKDLKDHEVKIKIWDFYDNATEVNFNIKGSDKSVYSLSTHKSGNMKPHINYKIRENTMKLSVYNPHKHYEESELIFENKKISLKNDYRKAYEDIFLWDLRKGIPDSIVCSNLNKSIDIKTMVPNNKPYQVYDKKMNVYFQKNSIFDTLYLQMDKKNDVFQLQSKYTPLFRSIVVTLKPDKPVSNKEKSGVFLVNSQPEFLGGEWKNNTIQFDTPKLGKYEIKKDSTAPVIYLRQLNNEGAAFKINDNLSGIKSLKATVNGEFLLMHYDYKRRMIWSRKLHEDVPLKGKFKLKVTDNLNNTKVFERNIY